MPQSLSYWERERLIGGCDVVVIGAGIVGLNTAIRFKTKHPHARVAVFDRSPITGGGSSRNAGFACFGSVTELLEDLKTLSPEEVYFLVDRRYRGLQALRNMLGDDAIGYSACGGYEVFSKQDAPRASAAVAAIDQLNALLTPLTQSATYEVMDTEHFCEERRLSGFHTVIANRHEGAIDTGLMIRSLRKLAAQMGVEIYNGLAIEAIETTGEGAEILLQGSRIAVPLVFVCANGFAAELLPELDVKPARNLVMVTQPLPYTPPEGTYHMHEGYVYFRSIENRMLIGGGRHLDEAWSTAGEGVPPHIRAWLIDVLHTHITPGLSCEIDCEWTGYLGVGTTRQPIVQKIAPGIVCAVRMGGMGVAIGTLIGQEAADLAG